MGLSDIGNSANNLIGGLRDRIPFGRNNQNQNDEYYDDYYDDGYDEYYDDYDGQDGYDSYGYEEQQGAFSNRYSRSSYNQNNYGVRSPRLVSSEDIRATTSAYGVEPSYTQQNSDYRPASNSPAAQRIAAMGQSARESLANITHFSSAKKNAEPSYQTGYQDDYQDDGYDEFEDMATPATSINDFSSPFQRRNSSGNSSAVSSTLKPQSAFDNQAELNRKSAGLDSLFTPSSEPEVGSRSGYSYEPSTPAFASSGREFYVLRPASYKDAEAVVEKLRLNQIVVLALRSTDQELANRILDFSFGVSCALGAHVDCVAPQVFVFTCNSEMTLEEKHRLSKLGVM